MKTVILFIISTLVFFLETAISCPPEYDSSVKSIDDKESSYALFYMSPSSYQFSPPIYLNLNGSYVENENGMIKSFGSQWEQPPGCNDNEDCDPTWGSCYFIKVEITKAKNKWFADEGHYTKKWSGSFKKQDGCMIIEIK